MGHHGYSIFMVKHGLLVETSAAPRIFSFFLTRPKMLETDPPDLTVHDAVSTLRMDVWDASGLSWTGFADDRFIKRELYDHTKESAKYIILSNATSIDATLAEGRYKQNLSKLEIVLLIRRYIGSKDGTRRSFSVERSWVELDIFRGRYAFSW